MTESTASHVVLAAAPRAVAAMAERAALPTAPLFVGLPFDREALGRIRHIAWDDYAVLCDRIEVLAGGTEELCDLIEANYTDVLPELRAVAGAFVGPKPFARFVCEVLDPLVFGAIAVEIDDLGDDLIRIRMHLRPGARSSGAWFRGTIGAVRGMTRYLALPPAEVLRSEISDRHGVYDVKLPRSQALPRRLARKSRDALGMMMSFLGMAAIVPEKDPFGEHLDDATVSWDLTRRQIEVLKLLARGKANKEIAQAFDCAESTVELHVTQLLKKARVSSRTELVAAFWRR